MIHAIHVIAEIIGIKVRVMSKRIINGCIRIASE